MRHMFLALIFCALIALPVARAADTITLAIAPEKVLNRVDEKIYGHFLEHIYHSVNGGLWGELVWDRSFELAPNRPTPGRKGVTVPHWEPYGKGKVEPSTETPLNGDRCQRIVCDGGETGLRQSPVCIRQGETYRGSLWARGEAPGGLVVRLLDGEKVIAEEQLPPPGSQWQEHPFKLKSDVAAGNGALQIGVRGKGKVWLDQVSMMPESWRAGGGCRPDLLQAIADLKPPVIRWPGGSFVSAYRWKGAIGPQHRRIKYPAVMWDDVDVNSFGIDEFVAMCRRVGAEPLVVVNIVAADKPEKRADYCQEACDWVEYCNGPADSTWGKVRAGNGHPAPYRVKYWEIDNEIWRLKPDDYVSIVQQFVPAMKKIDPTIITIACGSGQLGKYWGPGDAAVIAGCADLVDYLSVHHYEDAAAYATGPADAEKFWRNRAEMIAKSANPKIKLYVSEWNAQCTDWRTGLYAGGALNVFERCGDSVGMAGPALFLRHVSASGWDNAFVNFDHRTWFPAPNYVVMKLWREHYAPQRVELTGDAGALDIVATKTDDGKVLYFKAVNPGERPVPVELKIGEGFFVGKASAQVVAPDSLHARNTLDNPNAVRAVAMNVETKGQTIRFTLPRWSAGVVVITKK